MKAVRTECCVWLWGWKETERPIAAIAFSGPSVSATGSLAQLVASCCIWLVTGTTYQSSFAETASSPNLAGVAWGLGKPSRQSPLGWPWVLSAGFYVLCLLPPLPEAQQSWFSPSFLPSLSCCADKRSGGGEGNHPDV